MPHCSTAKKISSCRGSLAGSVGRLLGRSSSELFCFCGALRSSIMVCGGERRQTRGSFGLLAGRTSRHGGFLKVTFNSSGTLSPTTLLQMHRKKRRGRSHAPALSENVTKLYGANFMSRVALHVWVLAVRQRKRLLQAKIPRGQTYYWKELLCYPFHLSLNVLLLLGKDKAIW